MCGLRLADLVRCPEPQYLACCPAYEPGDLSRSDRIEVVVVNSRKVDSVFRSQFFPAEQVVQLLEAE